MFPRPFHREEAENPRKEELVQHAHDYFESESHLRKVTSPLDGSVFFHVLKEFNLQSRFIGPVSYYLFREWIC